MKAIIVSINPKWVAKILNGEKTIEIRKRFPKDYVGWVYIYCTKTKPRAILTDKGVIVANTLTVGGNSQYKSGYSLSGEVVARFWCDKVEDFGSKYAYAMKDQHFYDILEGACLTIRGLTEYAPFTHEQLIKGKTNLYAIHITNLEIFDEPKDIREFKRCTEKVCIYSECHKYMHCLKSFTRAPQSWCYVKL